MSKDYYEVSFDEIDICQYTIEASSKKEALKFAINLWNKKHKNIPVISCLSHHSTKKVSKEISLHYSKKDIKKILSKF